MLAEVTNSEAGDFSHKVMPRLDGGSHTEAAAQRRSERMRIREPKCRATKFEAKKPNHTLFQFFEALSI
jgi:hypothetical protein